MRAATHRYETRNCGRCAGTGIIRQYVKVNGGECFQCHGAGAFEVLVPLSAAELADNAAAAAQAARVRDEFAGNPFAALAAAHA